MELATKKRVPVFYAIWKRALRALAGREPNSDAMAEENRRDLCVSWPELGEQEFGIPPHRSGGRL